MQNKKEIINKIIKLIKECPNGYLYKVVYFKFTKKMGIYFDGVAKTKTIKQVESDLDSLETMEVKYFISKEEIKI